MDDLRMHLFPDGHVPPQRQHLASAAPAASRSQGSSREAELLYLLAKKTQELERVGRLLERGISRQNYLLI
jgi:hypothetical protein